MRFRLLPYLLLLLAAACVPLGTPITDPNVSAKQQPARPAEYYADRTLRYQDYIYDPSVRSVQCYVPTGAVNAILQPPIVPLSQDQPVVLEFDVLGTQAPRLTARLVHCDLGWTPSQLTDLQFLSEINEFTITSYLTAVNTKVPYYHYTLQLPRVKISGNYVLVVQNQGGVPLLSRRVLVYENRVVAQLEQGIIAGGQGDRYAYQQLNFRLNYSGLELTNPAAEVKVVLRQNYRWDNARYNLAPTFVRDAERILEYQYFNFENAFPGLSEYRYFDIRSLQAVGMGVGQLLRQSNPVQVDLLPETSRGGLAYNRYPDANGQRVFENKEFGNGAVNGDYAQVTFHLATPKLAPGPVYVFGALTDWQLKDEFRMSYDTTTQQYTGRTLLKQGYYNYSFAVAAQRPAAAPDEVYFEGTHTETENLYDLLVYYRPPGARTDLLIAYQAIDLNKL